MHPPVSSRIVRVSQRLAALSLLVVVVMLLLNAASWLMPVVARLGGLRFGLSARIVSRLALDLVALGEWQRLGAALLSSVPLLALALALLNLRALFQRYARGEYFSAAAADHFGNVGRAVLALFLAACITAIAHILRQASDLEQEHRQFV
ncbi:DUF2975 domain-containing protein [Cupriavidus basilensis]|uniref:DUF2975 domain-containing protein n=1 Tax=Cupriavidus basilensis TaxID=68895 RepID=UPI0039F71D2E